MSLLATVILIVVHAAVRKKRMGFWLLREWEWRTRLSARVRRAVAV